MEGKRGYEMIPHESSYIQSISEKKVGGATRLKNIISPGKQHESSIHKNARGSILSRNK